MAILLNGEPVARALSQEIQAQCAYLSQCHVRPSLAIVRVGEKGDDISYERGAAKRAASLGVEVQHFVLPDHVSSQDLMDVLRQISSNPAIHGCLILRPLPAQCSLLPISDILPPEKDIDALTATSMGSLLTQNGIGFAPCTASACLELLKFYQIPLKGKKTVVIGKSSTVGLPTALLLMNEDATVSVCHIYTQRPDIKRLCQDADIIVSAAGCPNLIRADDVAPGQVVVDIGVNVGPDGKLSGDVAFSEVSPIVAAITPVPGGVGAVTSTILVKHTVEAALRTVSPLP